MQNNFPKIPLILSSVFFCVSLIGFFFFFKEINDNNKELQLKETTWQKESIRREDIKKLDQSVKVIEEESKELEKHFAKSSDVVPFLDTLEGLGKASGVKAETTSVDITPNKTALMVGMRVSGTFGNVYKFVTLLENSPYEIEFIGVDMHKDGGADKWNAAVRIKLLSFVN
ncbi:hypothetical protein HYZ82_02635 [Candidatus Nomurabacteria bacterium]|nr:hypothetical protein [Candidatus Nomurabacteria bacterium]